MRQHALSLSRALSLSHSLVRLFAAFFSSISASLVNLCTRYVIWKRECVSRSFKVEYGYVHVYAVCSVIPLKLVSVCFLFYAFSIILGHPYTECLNGITKLWQRSMVEAHHFTSHTLVTSVLAAPSFAIILPDLDVTSYIYGSFDRLWPVLTYYRRWMSNM